MLVNEFKYFPITNKNRINWILPFSVLSLIFPLTVPSYHRQMQSASEDPETIDGSDLDEENSQSGANSVGDGRAWDAASDGINNAAFSAGSSCSTVGSRRRHGYRAKTMLSIDDDDNVVFLEDSVIEEGDEDYWAGLTRKGSSRSFVLNPPGFSTDSPKSPPRKFSDSLYPPWKRSHHSPYVLPLSSRFHKHSLSDFMASNSPPTSPQPLDADRTFYNVDPTHENSPVDQCKNNTQWIFGSGGNSNPPRPLPEGGNTPTSCDADGPHRSTITIPDLLPPENSRWHYYYSPTSSSIQTLSEERREFSPLSSPATPHTDEEFPGCMETSFSGSVTSLNPCQRSITNSSSSPLQTLHQQQLGFEPKSPTQTIRRDIRLDPVRLSSTSDLTYLSPVHEHKPSEMYPETAPELTLSELNSNLFSPATLEIDQNFDYQSPPPQDECRLDDKRKDNSQTQASSIVHSTVKPEKPTTIRRNNSAVFTIEEEPKGHGLRLSQQKQYRRASLDSEHVNKSRKSRAPGYYFRRNLRLKVGLFHSSERTPSSTPR